MAARRADPRSLARAEGDSGRAVRADGGASRNCPTTSCSSHRSRWRPPRTRSSWRRCGSAHIAGALVGVESVTPEGLKSIYKDFNLAGDGARRAAARRSGATACTSWGRSSSGCRPTAADTFDATLELATRADLTFAQFVMLTPFPGTVDFARWEASTPGQGAAQVGACRSPGTGSSRDGQRPKLYTPHPTHDARRDPAAHAGRVGPASTASATSGDARAASSRCKARLAFVLISKLYRQMYANTGIATDSARVDRASRWARWIARPCRRLFAASPMPDLQVPPLPEEVAGHAGPAGTTCRP